MEKRKNQILLTVLAIITLIGLIVGATYAFFAVNTSSNFGTTTINAQARSIGSVTLTGTNAALEMDLTPLDMKQTNAGTFYASSTGKVKDPDEPVIVTIGTATVTPNDDTNYYHCSYNLTVSHTGENDMYNLFNHKTDNEYDYTNRSTGQIILTVNGTKYDWASEAGMPSTIPGEFNIKAGSPVDIEASLKFVNLSSIDQTYLAGSDIEITIELESNSLSCTVEEDPNESFLYYTYEGQTVYSVNAHKVANYRNLNVWQREYSNYIYTYANEAACNSAIQGTETCSQKLQHYFTKETNKQLTSTVTLYELLVSIDGGSNFDTYDYYTQAELTSFLTSQVGGATVTCDGETPTSTGGLILKCAEHDPGFTYSKVTNKICANVEGTVVCMDDMDWDNAATIKQNFEAAGLNCAYNDNTNWVGNTKPQSGYLRCSDEDPTNGMTTGELVCQLRDGLAECGIQNEGSCGLNDSGIECG